MNYIIFVRFVYFQSVWERHVKCSDFRCFRFFLQRLGYRQTNSVTMYVCVSIKLSKPAFSNVSKINVCIHYEETKSLSHKRKMALFGNRAVC